MSGFDPPCVAENYDACRAPACVTDAGSYEVAADGELYFFLGGGAKSIFDQNGASAIDGCHDHIARVEAATNRTCYNTDIFQCKQ